MPGDARHWDDVYGQKASYEVTWFQSRHILSLALIEQSGIGLPDGLIDVGGGPSTLVDDLIEQDYENLTVLDLSAKALESAQSRLGAMAKAVTWVQGDITQWTPDQVYALWHDRAAFHFLTDPARQEAYIATLKAALPQGGWVVMATFALDGPEKCSGLPVQRYSPESLTDRLGQGFELVESRFEDHRTPNGGNQHFSYALIRFQ
ncbi:trans-aconitate 2-methyltransferase [Magnetospira sp. QH-2]|uniref:class I SAM-dependent methyltransferase n=1 Tax=Magnetospira sp. (strain QH-2) TaxID=1288970 RepID=UPI0003E81347|nr:class I SAM-dependent methyltransferase [Magnetospira sp. QH-2]CCQ73558.1 Conserved protein of unknown function [Magnetospira sp. QH-2]